MLARLIRTIRHKPKAVRDQYAFWSAVAVTGLVVVVWLVSLPDRLATLSSEEAAKAEPVFSGFLSEVKDGLSGLGSAVSDLTDVTTSEQVSDQLASSTASTQTANTATTTAATTTVVTEMSEPSQSVSGRVVRIGTSSATSSADQ